MPRILMTYAEIAENFGGSPASARQNAIDLGLTRYKGSDNVAYVQLPEDLVQAYLQRIAVASVDLQVSALRQTAERMQTAERSTRAVA